MFKKSLIPIICILIFQTKLSSCLLPLFFDLENDVLKYVPLSETVIVNSLFLTDKVETQDQEQYQDEDNHDEYFDRIQKLEDNLNKEQDDFIHKYILNEQKNQFEPQVEPTTQQHQDSSYIYLEFNRNIEQRQAEDLLEYISKFTSIPLESFKELSVRNNLIICLFDSKNVSTSNLVNKILKYQLKISKEKGLEILSCGLVKNNEKLKFDEMKKSEQNREILIIFGIVFLTALCTILIVLLIGYMLKKRFMNQEYLEKKTTDEEECLIINDSKKEDSKWFAYVPFVKNKKTQQQSPAQDYQRMASKVSPINSAISPMADAQTPALPSPANCQVVNTNTINSTPIRITDSKADQRNSSW